MAPMSPGSTLESLNARMDRRYPDLCRYEDYYAGRHALAFATAKYREAFGHLFAAAPDNWMKLVVNASVERLRVQGFRFGSAGPGADEDAWRMWQANNLDADSVMLHREAVKCGEAYTIVSPPPPGSDMPRVTVEHPSQVIVAHATGDRRRREAALKRWVDTDGFAYAILYLPDQVLWYRSQQKHSMGGRIAWRLIEGESSGPNPFGVVPVVPFYNAPTMLGGGMSDLIDAMPIQDKINKLGSDMMIGAEFQAFRQRVITGYEVPRDPVTGEPLAAAELKAAQSRLWTFSDPNARVSDLPAADLQPYVAAIEMWVQHLAAQTHTPPHYILGRIVNASGEALKAAETGLVAKTEDKKLPFGESWEETIRLCFRARGNTARAEATDSETIWADSESRTESQHIDAVVKKKDLGVPQEQLWEDAGYSPQQIQRFKALKEEEALTADPLAGFMAQPSTQGVPAQLAGMAANAVNGGNPAGQ